MKLSRRLVLLAAIALISSPTSPSWANPPKGFKGVASHLVVNARPQTIYEQIRALRHGEASGVKEISKTDSEAVLEEHFQNLPIIGKAKCIYVEKYTPWSRIDYHMIESDKFKAFEGSWQLTPQDDNSVLVELCSFVDTGLPIPFGRQITNTQTMKDIKDRLQLVKKKAEASESSLGAASGTH